MEPAEEDLDTQAEALIARTMQPKRRVRPRLAEPLHDAEPHEIDTPTGSVTAWRLGDGPATLLVHGWEDDNALWGPMIDRLLANGRAVVAMDLPGHGYSAAELNGIDGAGAATRAVAQALGPIDSVVGHSFGCLVCVSALDDGLSVDLAVLIASPLGRRRDPETAVAAFIERGVDPAVAARAGVLMTERQAAPYDVEGAAQRMTAKALVIHSMDDDDCPPGNASRIADAWPGAELIWTDGLGHRRVAQDGDVIQRIADFIEGFG